MWVEQHACHMSHSKDVQANGKVYMRTQVSQ